MQASGCYKEGTKAVTGISGDTEYYCQDHYNEMQNTINSMEQDVGNGSTSRHTCEECSREGTHMFDVESKFISVPKFISFSKRIYCSSSIRIVKN